MILDTSAVMAILQDEPERRRFTEAIERAAARRMSVATFVELSVVVESRFGADGLRHLDHFLDRAGVEQVAVDADQASEARHAYSRYGKGRHPTGLNYGDLFAYALAKRTGEPLLFKGEDFARTDVIAVDQ